MMGNLHCKGCNVEGLFFLLSVSLQFGDVHMGQLFQREDPHVALIPSFTPPCSPTSEWRKLKLLKHFLYQCCPVVDDETELSCYPVWCKGACKVFPDGTSFVLVWPSDFLALIFLGVRFLAVILLGVRFLGVWVFCCNSSGCQIF